MENITKIDENEYLKKYIDFGMEYLNEKFVLKKEVDRKDILMKYFTKNGESKEVIKIHMFPTIFGSATKKPSLLSAKAGIMV